MYRIHGAQLTILTLLGGLGAGPGGVEKQKRELIVKLGQEHRGRGYAALHDAIGHKSHELFVCLHVREPGFRGDQKGRYQTMRNADIETYRLAVAESAARGWAGNPCGQSIHAAIQGAWASSITSIPN